MLVRARLHTALAAAVLLAVTGCGSEPTIDAAAAATPAAAPAQALPASPTDVRASVGKTHTTLSWSPPQGPSTSFELYLDREAALTVKGDTRTYRWGPLDPGSQHYAQVVAVVGGQRSRPADVAFTVPWAAAPSGSQTAVPERDETAGDSTAPPATAPVTTGQAAAVREPAAAPSGRFTVKGTLGFTSIRSQELNDVAGCDGSGLRLTVSNGRQEIVGLATLSPGKARDVKREQGVLAYTCDHSYSIELSEQEAVYVFRAYYEGLEDNVEAWTTTQTVAALKDKAPRPYLSHCIGCR